MEVLDSLGCEIDRCRVMSREARSIHFLVGDEDRSKPGRIEFPSALNQSGIAAFSNVFDDFGDDLLGLGIPMGLTIL
jgi:hypothetical protein